MFELFFGIFFDTFSGSPNWQTASERGSAVSGNISSLVKKESGESALGGSGARVSAVSHSSASTSSISSYWNPNSVLPISISVEIPSMTSRLVLFRTLWLGCKAWSSGTSGCCCLLHNADSDLISVFGMRGSSEQFSSSSGATFKAINSTFSSRVVTRLIIKAFLPPDNLSKSCLTNFAIRDFFAETKNHFFCKWFVKLGGCRSSVDSFSPSMLRLLWLPVRIPSKFSTFNWYFYWALIGENTKHSSQRKRGHSWPKYKNPTFTEFVISRCFESSLVNIIFLQNYNFHHLDVILRRNIKEVINQT